MTTTSWFEISQMSDEDEEDDAVMSLATTISQTHIMPEPTPFKPPKQQAQHPLEPHQQRPLEPQQLQPLEPQQLQKAQQPQQLQLQLQQPEPPRQKACMDCNIAMSPGVTYDYCQPCAVAYRSKCRNCHSAFVRPGVPFCRICFRFLPKCSSPGCTRKTNSKLCVYCFKALTNK